MIRFLLTLCLLSTAHAVKPNILLMLADDVGHISMNKYGADLDLTPNIDVLAEGGMLLENMFTYNSCAPTRAALLTGRSRDRTGVTGPVGSFRNLSTNEVTLASMLRDAGYETCISGKGNINHEPTSGLTNEQAMEAHGFDYNLSFDGATIDYGSTDHVTNFTPRTYMQHSLDFLANRNTNKPYFLYHAFGLAHQPWDIGTPDNPGATNTPAESFEAKLVELDFIASNLISSVDGDTLIIFLGDNGTPGEVDVSFQGQTISGGKLTDQHTGIQVPMFIRWPGYVATNTTYAGLTQVEDLSVTLLDVVGAAFPNDRLYDGISLKNQLLGGPGEHRRTVILSGSQGCAFNKTHKYIDALGGELYSLATSPLTEPEISAPIESQFDLVNWILLKGGLENREEAQYGDTPWGGHTNERVFLTTP